MKHYNNLFQEIITKENILLAHKRASKGKQHYTAVKIVNQNLDKNIELIQDMLINQTYEITKKDYRYELINDKGKERDLYKLD